MAEIALNLFAIDPARFPLIVFCREYREGLESPEGATRRRLALDGGNPRDYWVSATERDGFERHTCFSDANRELTKDLIFAALKAQSRESLEPSHYRLHPRELRRRVFFLLKERVEGRQEVWVEPYYLATASRFGLLADFTFTPAEGHRGTRRAQQLALSLDHRFQANVNFYADRFSMLEAFVRAYQEKLFALVVAATPVAISRKTHPCRQPHWTQSPIYSLGSAHRVHSSSGSNSTVCLGRKSSSSTGTPKVPLSHARHQKRLLLS